MTFKGTFQPTLVYDSIWWDECSLRCSPRHYDGFPTFLLSPLFPFEIHQQPPGTWHYPGAVGSAGGFLCQSRGETLGVVLCRVPDISLPKGQLSFPNG